jgi:hypothetical protein
MATITVYPSYDGTVTLDQDTEEYGYNDSLPTMSVDMTGAVIAKCFLDFAMPAEVQSASAINSVTLHLFYASDGSAITAGFYGLDATADSKTPDDLAGLFYEDMSDTFDEFISCGGNAFDDIYEDGGWTLAGAETVLAAHPTWFTLLITDLGGGNALFYTRLEDIDPGDYRPYLVIDYIPGGAVTKAWGQII